MRHSPAMAARALALAGDLNESAYRRIEKFHATCKANESGGFPASTIHGGRRASGISDPTGTQAINPEADPARFDLHQAYADLLQATRLLGCVETTICAFLGGLPLHPLPYRQLRVPRHAIEALDLGGYLIERLEDRWEAFDRCPTVGRFDLSEAYNDLDHALRLLSAVDDVMCRWLGGDPKRVHCQNPSGCPSGNIRPKSGHYLCWACLKHRSRHGEDRTRESEARLLARGDPVTPPAGLAGVELGVGEGCPAQAATGPHSGWLTPGLDTYGHDPQPEPVDEGVA